MEIEKTFIIKEGDSPNGSDRFRKVYLCSGRYFMQAPQGAIEEISKEEFEKKVKNTIK